MTTTTRGPSRFATKYVVLALAIAATVLIVAAISQWTESQDPPLRRATPEVSTDVSSLEVAANRHSDAFAYDKVDFGHVPIESLTPSTIQTDPEIVVIPTGGGLHEALAAGKLTMDADPNVRCAISPSTDSGLWEAYESGQLREGIGTTTESNMESQAAYHAETVSGEHRE